MSDPDTAARRRRAVIGVVFLVFMGASAAYNANLWDLRDRFNPPAQRLASPPATPPPLDDGGQRPNPTPFDRRSQPWWQTVSTFDGQGATTTGSFTVASHALQWRVKWSCGSGTFTATPVSSSGTKRRTLANAKACPAEGEGFSTNLGAHTLLVETGGPWKVTVEQQVDVPMIEEPVPGMTSPQAQVLAKGSFYGVDREGRGTVRIFRLPDGSRALRLDEFFVSINSDLEIWLSELPEPKSTQAAFAAPHKQVSFLKATTGAMNYQIDPSIDLSRYKSIVIWCDITHNAYAAASLSG